jgi:hypothetical protein
MQCPGCEAQNAAEAVKCAACGKRLPGRRKRALAGEWDDAADPVTDRWNRAGIRAYRWSLIGLLPGIGLLLGPLAVLLGVVTRLRGARLRGFSAERPANAAIVLGGLITASQWSGAMMMLRGWLGRP